MSMMEPKIECDLHEDVLPWLKEKIAKFTEDDCQAVEMANTIIEAGIAEARIGHGKTLKAREERLAAEAKARDEAAKKKELMRQ